MSDPERYPRETLNDCVIIVALIVAVSCTYGAGLILLAIFNWWTL